ncbi:HNH endonuclease [Pseudomonas sp. 21TX0197]|uniref:HNH endonuclease n=1 Tax=Pseudomonas sp. 21TX0197 TaxID=2972639 RepID=UPI00232FDBC8|nr:HNH endonuclease [Pseudomonas sp. 21TX0197]MDB6446110.1 HNH endonuclease [Pseudomonas sp. 21TX0197]
MGQCIYCREEKDEQDFTLEHVIPQFLGGANAPDFFKTRDVCKSCNNNLGLFVDASFEKNWMVSNWLRQSSSAFYDKDKPVGVSLICMGNSDLRPPEIFDDHICEIWLGPNGEQVFWIRPHDKRMSSYVGGNPRTMKSTETRAYFLFSENTQNDPLKTWLSFEQAFNGRRVKKILCAEVQGVDPTSIGFTPPDDLDRARQEFFLTNTLDGLDRKMQITIDPNFDQRFMCKLAIGVAYCLFGPKVLHTTYGNELHKGLWHRDGNKEPEIRGTVLFSNASDPVFNQLVGFPSAVTLGIHSSPAGVAINLNICSQLNWTILCAPNEILTESNLTQIDEGLILVLVRAINTGIYLDLPSFLSHKTGANSHPALKAIEERLEKNTN